jgi:hypothetical protein
LAKDLSYRLINLSKSARIVHSLTLLRDQLVEKSGLFERLPEKIG